MLQLVSKNFNDHLVSFLFWWVDWGAEWENESRACIFYVLVVVFKLYNYVQPLLGAISSSI